MGDAHMICRGYDWLWANTDQVIHKGISDHIDIARRRSVKWLEVIYQSGPGYEDATIKTPAPLFITSTLITGFIA